METYITKHTDVENMLPIYIDQWVLNMLEMEKFVRFWAFRQKAYLMYHIQWNEYTINTFQKWYE